MIGIGPERCTERTRLDLERFAEPSKMNEVRALEAVIEEVSQWPDVRQAFKDAFALLPQGMDNGAANGRPAADGNPTGSN